MRVVDLRSTPSTSTPTVGARASSAAELLRTIGVLIAGDADEYDVGGERIRAVRDALPAGLLDDIEAFAQGDDKTFLVLSIIAAELDAPADVDQLVTAITDDPGLTWRLLLAHQTQGWEEAPDDLAVRLAAGDEDAVTAVRRLADDGPCPAGVRSLLGHAPSDHGQHILDIVQRFRDAVWHDLERESMGPIQRDVDHRNGQVAAGADVATVVLEATNGYELGDDPAVEHVLLLPSYWLRPWVVVGRLGSTEVLSSPVADQFLALPSEAPPPALLKLFKALSDEGRLRLLRRMAGGPISLTDAVAELDVAKATAHHHLSILRQAGLVSIRGEGRTTRYALREDPPALARDTLSEYVRPGP